MGVVNLGQVAALIQSVTVEELPEGATPTVRNEGTKANADLVFGLPAVITKAKVQELINTKLIEHYKNGYIQLPGMPSPLEDVNLHFEGYSWHEVNYDGNFFRAKGRNAKAFSAKKLTKEQIKKGAYIFQDDEQGDAIRNIEGYPLTEEDEFPFWGRGGVLSGALETKKHSQTYNHIMGANYLGGEHRLYFGSINFDASRVVPTAEENRSRNLTFALWALVKDE